MLEGFATMTRFDLFIFPKKETRQHTGKLLHTKCNVHKRETFTVKA